MALRIKEIEFYCYVNALPSSGGEIGSQEFTSCRAGISKALKKVRYSSPINHNRRH